MIRALRAAETLGGDALQVVIQASLRDSLEIGKRLCAGASQFRLLVFSRSDVCQGGLALLLASVGLFGLLAFAVVQRIDEMGIRIALGAMRGDVVWMILREALTLVLIGIAIGVPAALALSRFASSHISGLLFGLTATDPLTIAAARRADPDEADPLRRDQPLLAEF